MSLEKNTVSTNRGRHFRWARFWLAAPAPEHRGRSIVIVLAVLTALGWVDYAAGFWISLQLFYVIPTLMSVVWLGARSGAAIAALCVVVRVVGDAAAGMFDHVAPIAVFWNRLAELCVYWILIWVFNAFITLQRDLEERVRQRTASLEQAVAERDELQKQLFEVARLERSAIGHDLHDGLGQHLTATSIAANILAARLTATGNPEGDHARKIVDLLQEAIANTRQIARGLLLSAVEPAELSTELDELAATIRKEHGIACVYTLSGTVGRISVATASHLFYIAQEAARNSVRHGSPTLITIECATLQDHLTLSITDNGSGIASLDPERPGMGLRIMHHRSQLIGGDFTVTSVDGTGTRIQCRIPLPSVAST